MRRSKTSSQRFRRGTSRKSLGSRGFQRKVQAVIEQKLTASNFFNATATGQFAAAAGQQTFFVTPPICAPTTLQSIATNIDASKTTEFTIRNYQVEYRVVNSTNVGKMWLTAYRCVARKDVPLDATASSQFNTLTTMATLGFQDANAGLGSTHAPIQGTDVGATLFQNPLWTQFFKIKKVKEVCLLPGQVYIDKHTFRGPKKWNKLDFADNNLNLQYLCMKGFGVTVFRAHGAVVESVADETKTNWGVIDVNAEQYVRTTYSWIDDRTTASGTTQTNNTFVDPQEVNVMTGIEAPVTS